MDTDTGTLEIPSLTTVPTLRAPMPTLAIPSPTKSPADILRDPRFAKLPAAEQTAIKKMVAARITGTPAATTGAMPSSITPGSPISKPIMPELARKAKLRDQATRIIRLLDDMNDLYTKRIQPKIQSGQISSTKEGAKYIFPTYGGKVDPDVETFMLRSGNLATELNSYYAAGGGGKSGMQSYENIVKPHVPAPPGGTLDLTGHPLEGRQWNLEQQGGWVPMLKRQVMIDEGLAAPGGYAPLSSTNPAATSDGADDPFGMRKYEK